MNVFRHLARSLLVVAGLSQASSDLSVDQLLANGKAEWRAGRFQEAFKLCNEAVELAPKNAEAYYGRGAAQLALKQLDKAIEDFDTAIALCPTVHGAHGARGIARISRGDFEGALADHAAAIEIDPSNPLVFKNRSFLHALLGNADAALADANAAIRLRPEDLHAYYRRCVAYHLMGRLDLALADANAVIRLGPECPWGFERRAFIRLAEENFPAAIEDATKALDREGCDPEVYAVRASAYAGLQRRDEASEDWRRFTKHMEFNFDRVARDNARHALCVNDVDGATILCTEILGRQQYDFEALSIRGRAHLANKQIDDAIADLSRAVRIGADGSPASLATVYEARGKAYENSRRAAEAKADLMEATRLRAQGNDRHAEKAIESPGASADDKENKEKRKRTGTIVDDGPREQ